MSVCLTACHTHSLSLPLSIPPPHLHHPAVKGAVLEAEHAWPVQPETVRAAVDQGADQRLPVVHLRVVAQVPVQHQADRLTLAGWDSAGRNLQGFQIIISSEIHKLSHFHTHTFTHTLSHTHTFTHTHTHTHTHVHTHTYTHTHTHTHFHTYTHIHTHFDTYTHTHTHTHKQGEMFVPGVTLDGFSPSRENRAVATYQLKHE